MAGYGFRDFGEGASTALPSIQLRYNGVTFDSRLTDSEGSFRTLSVSGRGVMAKELDLIDIPQLDGGLHNGAVYPTRTITVKYMLKDRTNEGLRKRYEEMNGLLMESDRKIEFTDEEWYYIGTHTEASDAPEEGNTVVNTLTFVCPRPFKYKNIEEIEVTEQDYEVVNTSLFPILPRFEFTLAGDVSTFYIRNITTGRWIRMDALSESFSQGDYFAIDAQKSEVIRNGQNGMRYMHIESDFEDFTVRDGDVVRIEPANDFTLLLRAVSI